MTCYNCNKCDSKEHVHFRQSMEYVCDKCIHEDIKKELKKEDKE